MTQLTSKRVVDVLDAEGQLDPEELIQRLEREHGWQATRDVVLRMLETGVLRLNWDGKLRFAPSQGQ